MIKDIEHFVNKILVFYKPNKATYWHKITPCCVTEKPDQLGRYYLDFSSKAEYPNNFDDKGIPLYKYPNESEIYQPIIIAQYALGLFEKLFQSKYNDYILRSMFLKQADWFISTAFSLQNGLAWYLNYDINEYGLKRPYISALEQGEIISVLTRAYLITHKEEYLSTARKAAYFFELPVDKGCLLNYFENILIFEEYPSRIRTFGVFNGFMFSLFEIFDLSLITNDKKYTELYFQGIDAVKKLFPYYDTGFWSSYYLFDYPQKYISSYNYHCIMLEQLSAHSVLSVEKELNDFTCIWRNYTNSYFNRTRALMNKLLFSRKVQYK